VAARNPASAARVAISVAATRVVVADLLYCTLRGLPTARDRWRSACNHTDAEREAAGDDKAGEWAFHTFSDHCFSLRTRRLVETWAFRLGSKNQKEGPCGALISTLINGFYAAPVGSSILTVTLIDGRSWCAGFLSSDTAFQLHRSVGLHHCMPCPGCYTAVLLTNGQTAPLMKRTSTAWHEDSENTHFGCN
jgi:hypothetical protein